MNRLGTFPFVLKSGLRAWGSCGVVYKTRTTLFYFLQPAKVFFYTLLYFLNWCSFRFFLCLPYLFITTFSFIRPFSFIAMFFFITMFSFIITYFFITPYRSDRSDTSNSNDTKDTSGNLDRAQAHRCSGRGQGYIRMYVIHTIYPLLPDTECFGAQEVGLFFYE